MMAAGIPGGSAQSVPVLRFKQWLDIWDAYNFDGSAHGRKPEPYIYLFSMSAAQLRTLCDVYRRERTTDGAEGIQRRRDESRTGKILRYVRYGYPYGDLKPAQQTPDKERLRKPGWLPTAIVVNILVEGDRRRGRQVDPAHLVSVRSTESNWALVLPAETPSRGALAPLEVIDGQHRLWAFDDNDDGYRIPDDFELPVVAYHGLDVAWQAYLFWSINVSPKKINPSHAFDLYPLLRTQDWLESAGELNVYREARAQELTEILYTHPASPWKDRINMLGQPDGPPVRQVAWVRGLIATFLSTGRGLGAPGLFQTNLVETGEPLEWTRPQQAAFLIQLWRDVWDAVAAQSNRHHWTRAFGDPERALTSKTSLLNQDMGVRAVLGAFNDIFYLKAEEWRLNDWRDPDAGADRGLESEVNTALTTIATARFRPQMVEVAQGIAAFDWRSLEGPGVRDDENLTLQKRSYRGSGGYTVLKADVLQCIGEDDNPTNYGASAARTVRGRQS